MISFRQSLQRWHQHKRSSSVVHGHRGPRWDDVALLHLLLLRGPVPRDSPVKLSSSANFYGWPGCNLFVFDRLCRRLVLLKQVIMYLECAWNRLGSRQHVSNHIREVGNRPLMNASTAVEPM